MPDEPLPPDDPHAAEIARQKMALTIALVAIGLSAVLVLVGLRRFPLPLRLFLVAGDLIVMATLWLVSRQKFSGK
jgi:hypothetical protein